jgi:hypothetical protein
MFWMVKINNNMSKNTNLSFLTDYITADITNGRIGINNPSPAFAFDVSGTARVSSTFITGGNLTVGNSLSYGYIYGPSNQIFGSIGANTTWLNAGTSGLRINNAADNATLAFVSNAGNVGIGTTSPNYTLHIDANTTLTRFQITNSTTGQGGGVGLQIIQNGLDAIITNRSNGYLSFETVGTERMRITSAGNVGIGTSSPSTALEVNGSITGVQFFTSSSSGTIQNNTATTIFSSSGGGGVWLVTYTIDGNTPQAGYAIVGNARGSTLYIYGSGVGSQTSLSISGLNLQLTQTAGVALSYKYSVIKLNSI